MASMAQLYGPTELLIQGKIVRVTFYPEKLRHTVAVKASWCFDGDNHVRALPNEEYGPGAKAKLLREIESTSRAFLVSIQPQCAPVLVVLVGIDGGLSYSLHAHLVNEISALFTPVKYLTTLAESELNPESSAHIGMDQFEVLRRSNELLVPHDGHHCSWALNVNDLLALKTDFRAGLLSCRIADWPSIREFADAHGIHTRCFRLTQSAESIIAGLLKRYHDDSLRMTAAYAAKVAHVLENVQALQLFSSFDVDLELECSADIEQASRAIIREIKLFTTRFVLNQDHSEPQSAS